MHSKYDPVKGHHSAPWGGRCDVQTLYRNKLHHEFATDVVQLDFDRSESNDSVKLSVMYALLNAISDEMDIEREGISACYGYTPGKFSIVFYDTSPGGSGHVHRLVQDEGKSVERILKAAVSAMKRCTCESSCYSCLRGYYNQQKHELLDRTKAHDFLLSYASPQINWVQHS